MTTRTARSTAVRDLLREHGVTLSLGTRPVLTQLPRLLEDAELPLPVHLRTALGLVDAELRERETRIQTVEQQLTPLRPTTRERSGCFEVPGVGLLTATALVASVGHIHACRRGRQFASWLGSRPGNTPVAPGGAGARSPNRATGIYATS